MKEICVCGRGGQGSLVLAQFMAIAALEDNKYGQAFPFLGGGGERRGKPIMAFCRLDDAPIRVRSRVSQADYLIIQDPTIFKEEPVLERVKSNGLVIVNTDKKPQELNLPENIWVFTIPAEKLARKILGRPIINTALLGTFGALTKELSLEAIVNAVQKKFPGHLGEKNAEVVKQAYKEVSGGIS